MPCHVVGFVLLHGLTEEIRRRVCLCDVKAAAIRVPKDGGRRIHAERSFFKPQDSINGGNANKGAKMHVANQMRHCSNGMSATRSCRPAEEDAHTSPPTVRLWYNQQAPIKTGF